MPPQGCFPPTRGWSPKTSPPSRPSAPRRRGGVPRIGRHICALGEDRCLTQIQLAEKAGIDHKTVHRIEDAITDLSLSRLLRLAAALEV
ncbi:helix-turn-helix transcriptional regulator [Streptomyces rubiginosohelvolus]|uniref:helix-turn-helix domain-containing protein n=1 Tax=Streptomyces rubiginosohelvolus TaxID=67362 RepID=UPI0033BACAFC